MHCTICHSDYDQPHACGGTPTPCRPSCGREYFNYVLGRSDANDLARLKADNERLRAALTMIANPDGLAARADNFGRFAEEYQKYALAIARDALNH